MNKILIAEDEEAIANLIRSVLVGANYQCVWAQDGVQAADILEKEPFDLALLDIMLPGIDGYELLEYCKSLEVQRYFSPHEAMWMIVCKGCEWERKTTCRSLSLWPNYWPEWKRYYAAAAKQNVSSSYLQISRSILLPV